MHRFEGDTVALRPWHPDDAAALRAYLNHPDMRYARYLPWGYSDHLELTEMQVSKMIEGWLSPERELPLAIVRRSNGVLVGHSLVSWRWDTHNMDVELAIVPEQRRNGYGRDALLVMLDYVFGNTVSYNVSAWINEFNTTGIAFAEAVGFAPAGRERRVGLRNGAYYDAVVYDMLRPEYFARQGG